VGSSDISPYHFVHLLAIKVCTFSHCRAAVI